MYLELSNYKDTLLFRLALGKEKTGSLGVPWSGRYFVYVTVISKNQFLLQIGI